MRHVGFAKQPEIVPSAPAKPAVEKHCVFASEKFRDPPLELPMKIGHPGEHRRTACAEIHAS